MNDLFTVVVGMVSTLVLGLIIGLTATDTVWQRDCNLIGKHRSDDKVYFCFPEGGK